jgi:hypothetical protein
MSYGSARASAQAAIDSPNDQAIKQLAEAIYALSRAVEKDVKDLQREINFLKTKLR